MAELKAYDVDGRTLLLSDEDAKAAGLTGGRARAQQYSTPPENTDGSDEQEQARTGGTKPITSSKARAAANK